MTADEYASLLHELGRLRSQNATTVQAAHADWAARRDRVDSVATDLETERQALLDTAKRLRRGVPDLRTGADADRPTTITDAVDGADRSLATARRHREAAESAARLPPLLPRATPLLRNLVVYGLAMIACFGVQLALAAAVRSGALPGNASLWIAFLTPVLFLIGGYVATAFAGTPRLPTYDAKGDVVEFVVYKSPRLGAFLAVLTIVTFLLWDLGVL